MTKSYAILIAAICILFFLFLVITLARRKSRASSSGEPTANQIYVGNLPYKISDNQLEDYFSPFGNVRSVKIIRNAKTGLSKGFAFVTYANSGEAQKALDASGKELQGRTLVVRIAKPRKIE